MKYSKAVNVKNGDLTTYNRDIQLYPSKLINNSLPGDYEVHRDFSCQYDKPDVICTCKRTRKKYYISQDVYRAQERYPGWKSFTEIGVGSIKTLPKRRTRRIYLQETRDRGIGSAELMFEEKKEHHEYSYYEQKKTSSKCVGGIFDVNIPAINRKLSPIIQQKSGTTSYTAVRLENIGSNHSLKNTKVTSEERNNPKEHNQMENIINHNNKLPKQITREIISKRETCVEQVKMKPLVHHHINVDKDFSSDSLVQHVHNLENPSFDKQSKTSIDLMENKLEREYRKMFATKTNNSMTKPSIDKPSSDLKRASLLRRRFESLRKGLCKKEDSIKEAVIKNTSSRKSIQSRKDVSIASDPPSLEAKSYSSTKIYSPNTSFCHPYKNSNPTVSLKKSPVEKQVPSKNWSTEIIDSDCQSVRGMFKLWGKKFNFEEENNRKSNHYSNIPEKVVEIIIPEKRMKEKKGSKRFFFFNKRSKDKSKQIYKNKKGVTAGRCEVEDGLAMKIGPKGYSDIIPEAIRHNELENYDNILRKSWLKKFLSTKVDSRRSVKIRWNNNMYSTSSSTVFELLDCVYKNNRIFIGSKSEISTCDSSNYYAYNNQRTQFMPKHVEAWMIPETIVNSQYKASDVNIQKSRNIEVTYLDKKWYIDKSHRGNKIELVLQSNNIIRTEQNKSSDYILIDIPKGYFTDSMESNHHPTSDEEVYKVTDYESPNSKSSLCKRKTNFDTGDHLANYVHKTTGKESENTKLNTLQADKKTPLMRDVVIQGSQIYIPKLCDVIGVGIIMQRDIRDIKKPILKIHDDITDSESPHNLPPPKKCEFAESYLQDYYRNWIPLGIDFFSWCVSDSQLRSSENNSRTSLNNQGDGSKSCPNMIDDYQASTVVSSCNTSSCSHCLAFEPEKKTKEPKKDNFFSKLFTKNSDTGSTEARLAFSEGKRLLPKDSLEVFKRRKVYADGYNMKWNAFCPKPSSAASIENKSAENTSECPKKPKKHVLIPDCEPYDLPKQPCNKCFPGILTYKGSNTCKKKEKQKHTCVKPDPVCAIPNKPLCSNLCAKDCNPPCTKEKGKGHVRPCSGKLPPVCGKCSPMQPCEIEKFLQNCPTCPTFPQKCTKCCSPILPRKCPQCCSPILPQKCPKCSSSILPIKCAKCCLPIVPQKCPMCPSPPLQKCTKCSSSSLPRKCPKCSFSLLPNKCPKCSLPILPQNCPKCCSLMFPQKCPTCSTSILPQKCPKCSSPILPQKCPICPSPPLQKCQKCSSSSPPRKCPKCSFSLLPNKCPKCSLPILPQNCPKCCSLMFPQKCPTCSTSILPQKCPKCSSPILPQKCPICPSPPLQKCPKCSSSSPPRKCPKCSFSLLPNKCPKCSLPILPQKCPQCFSATFPQTCPTCSSSILPQKCPKCSSPISPQKCSNSALPTLSQKCPKCCSFILPQKCTKCSSQILPAQCPRCCSQILLTKCTKCSTQVNPQKSPKSCSPILPQKCPKCCTHILPQKCPRCYSFILPEKCLKCSTPILPLKCPKCCLPIQPQKCPGCSKIILSQECPKCSSQNISKCPSPRKSNKCDSATSTQKCPSPPKSPVKCISRQSPPRSTCPTPTKSLEITQSNCNNVKPDCNPCTNSSPCKICNSPKVIPLSGLKLHKSAYKRKESESNVSPCTRKCSPPPSLPSSFKCSTTQKESIESFKYSRPKRCPKDGKSNENLIRISSRENVKINLKKPTASTEEIRNGYNIKVQDEDGQTLYERIDYRKISNNTESKLLQNKICGDSYIHRVSTPSVVLNKIVLNENNYDIQKSATSLENLIEINLTLKFKQADKTEVNICNQGDIQKESKETEALVQSKEIFHMQDRTRDQEANDIDNTEKNEVNIKILIKNGIPANAENKSKHYVCVNNAATPATDDFSKNISDKFHTVSTGYSEFVLDQPVYPVEMTNLELEKSTDRIQNEKSSEQFLIEETIKSDEFILTASSVSLTERTATDNTISSFKDDTNFENKTDVSEKYSKDSLKNGQESNTEKSETGISMTDEEKFVESYFDQDRIAKAVKKLRGRQQKKEMLKKLFEEASCIDNKNKEKVKCVREMLHAILTSDSSGQDDTSDTGTNYELLKGLTYSSLKPHFRQSDSLTNFYNLDNTIIEENNNVDNEVLYPTKENNSACSDDTETDVEKPQRCMCSALAARLRMNTPGINPCCCQGCDKKDEEIHCNLNSDVKNLVDCQTQNSKNDIFKQSFVTTNVSTTVKIKSRESKKVTQSKTNTVSKVMRSSFQAFVKNQQVLLNLSDDDTVIYLSKNSNEFSYSSSNYDTDQLADILQSDETKKAVLEIYAEKTVTNEGSHFVAKLPKFVLSD